MSTVHDIDALVRDHLSDLVSALETTGAVALVSDIWLVATPVIRAEGFVYLPDGRRYRLTLAEDPEGA